MDPRSSGDPPCPRRPKARAGLSQQPAGGWLSLLPTLPPARPLQGRSTADFAVLGAGFTGLAAARRLAELRPEASVALLEARRAGEGASGRSSGFVVDLAGFIASMPAPHGERFVRLSRAGIERLRRQVAEGSIACDWDERGWLHVAAGEAGLASLGKLRHWLEGLGEAHDVLEGSALRETLGTAFYRRGIRLPGSVLVQAAALARGLAATLPDTVDLYEESPVVSIRQDPRRGRSWRLRTAAGELQAGALLLATNGETPSLGHLGQRLFPLLTFGSLSRPLSLAEQEALGGEREWGVLAQDPVGSSLRRTRDQRLLVRNHLAFARDGRPSPEMLARAQVEHRRALVRRYPALADLPFEHTWHGIMGISPNLYPYFGLLAPGLAAAAGYTGAGISMGTISGELLADLILDRDSPLLADRQALPGPRWLPPRPFLDWGIRIQVGRMNRSGGEAL